MADSERDEYEAAAREFVRNHEATTNIVAARGLASLLRQTAEKAVERVQTEVDRLEALFQQTCGVHHSWVAKAQKVDRLTDELAASRSESEALRADLDSATVLYAQARAESEALRAKLVAARDVLEGLRHRARNPMRSWDSGRVIDAGHVEDDCDDAIAAINSAAPGREPMLEARTAAVYEAADIAEREWKHTACSARCPTDTHMHEGLEASMCQRIADRIRALASPSSGTREPTNKETTP